jgi:secreted PhoX family phosphatase
MRPIHPLSLLLALAPSSLAQTPISGTNIPGFGALQPTVAENTPETLLELPPGFKYTVVIRNGDPMTDGNLSPSNADGMGAFQNGDLIRLLRNHERGNGTPLGNAALAYDALAGGGMTTLDIDPETRLLANSFVSLGGTIRNCAGGVTPWGTWITCEETNLFNAGTQKQHGYSFEVSASANTQVDGNLARRSFLGLLYPEAVAIDPETSIAYITMDTTPSGLFRFVPQQYGRLDLPGRLQMLAIEGAPNFNTATSSVLNVKLPVRWVDVSSPTDEVSYRQNRLVAYNEGAARGGASIARGEGAWYARSTVYFASTSGGAIGAGQIFALHLKNNDVQALELLFESTDREILDAPDNLCVTPGGNNLILCEDGSGAEYLHLLRRSGNQIYRLAKNIVPGQEGSEWAGAVFSPDGRTLFANLQGPGITFAIWPADGRWGTINN